MSILDTLVIDRTEADVNRIKAIMAKGLTNMSNDEYWYFVKGELEALEDSTDDGLVDSNGLTIGCRDGVLPKGAYNYQDLNRVIEAVEYVTQLIRSAGYAIDDPAEVMSKQVEVIHKNRKWVDAMNRIPNAKTMSSGGWRWWSTYTTNTLVNEGYNFKLKSVLPMENTHYTLANQPRCFTGNDKGHKYYIGCQYQNSSNATGVFSVAYNYSQNGSSDNTKIVALSELGQLTQYSEIWQLSSNYGFRQFSVYIKGTVTVGEEHYIRRPFMYDLTEAFGAGNEPTLEWCQENIGFDCDNFHAWINTDTMEAITVGDYDVHDIPTEEEMERYLDNIALVKNRLPLVNVRYPSIPSVPADMERLLPNEANDIEKILPLIPDTVERIEAERLAFFSGELYGGEL